MSERRTETTVNVYAGVPFNNKYKDVLFVSRDTLTSYLSQFEIGQSVSSNRFEIIDDTQAIIDLTNDFECMNANYCKVHRKIMPETNEDVYEYDSYYFVTRARQIATNVIRLYLELDVFQTQFNKYDYNDADPQSKIPQIKNSIVNITTDNDMLSIAKHYYSPIPFEKFNQLTVYKPFDVNFLTNKNFYLAFKYIEENGGTESVAILTRFHSNTSEIDEQQMFDIFDDLAGTSSSSLLFNEIVNTLRDTLKLYDKLNNAFNITLLGFYMIPINYIKPELFSTIEQNAIELKIKKNPNETSYWSCRTFDGKSFQINYETTISPTPYKQTFVGSLSKNIPLEYNANPYKISLKFNFNNDFIVRLEANNQIIDVTDAFELSLTNSDYGAYMQQNENGYGIKNISKAVLSLAGVASGNPISLLTATQTVSDFATEFGKIADLKKQPPKIESKASSGTGMSTFICVGIIENTPVNVDDITDAIKYTGYSMSSLQNKIFYYKEQPSLEKIPGTDTHPVYEMVQHNFDYYKFSNIQIVGEIPQNFQSQIEQMFLNGIRIWYNKDKFLQTIENKEVITE